MWNAPALGVTPQERAELHRRVRARTSAGTPGPAGSHHLLAADGGPHRRIATQMGLEQPYGRMTWEEEAKPVQEGPGFNVSPLGGSMPVSS